MTEARFPKAVQGRTTVSIDSYVTSDWGVNRTTNPSQGWLSGTERLTHSSESLILSGLGEKYFTTFLQVMSPPLAHPAKDNTEIWLPAFVLEQFFAVYLMYWRSAEHSALQLHLQSTLHGKERQALAEVMVQSGWALSLCEWWARALACSTS